MTTEDPHASYNSLCRYGGKELKRIIAAMLRKSFTGAVLAEALCALFGISHVNIF